MGGRTFDTVVATAPPADGDSGWTRRITVSVDGRKKIDCSIGDSPDGELFVYGVTVFPEDGTIEVAAVAADATEVFPPAEREMNDNPGVITDGVLEPAVDDGGAGTQPLDRAKKAPRRRGARCAWFTSTTPKRFRTASAPC